jgi:hypothetical protein
MGSISEAMHYDRDVCFSSRASVVSPHAARPKSANFSGKLPFLLRGLSYMRELPTERADSLKERTGGVGGGGRYLIEKSRSDT